MKQIKVIARGPIPEWFRKLSKDQQEQYLEDHPNSKIARTVAQEKQKQKVRKPSAVEQEKKQPSKKETEEKKKAAKKVVEKDANSLLVKEGSPSNFRGPRSKGDAMGKDAKKERRVVSQLDKLAKMAKDAKEKGKDAPNYNLCEVSIPGTNLFCEGNVGIPRKEMPQLKGKPVPGSWAEKNLTANKDGEVDGEDAFKKMLEEKGIKQTKKKVDVGNLKASQTELVGAKVAGMYSAVKAAYKKAAETDDPVQKAEALKKVSGITAPIFVSKDGYVLDGHHRWASLVGVALADGRPEPVEMDVIEVDMEIKDLIKETNDFANSIGIAQKAAKTTAKLVNMFGGCPGGVCSVPKKTTANFKLVGKTSNEKMSTVITSAHYRLNLDKSNKRTRQ